MNQHQAFVSKLSGYADQLATANERIKDLFAQHDEEISMAYASACTAETDEDAQKRWEYFEQLQQKHWDKMDRIADWLSDHNEQVTGAYLDSLES